MLFSYLFINGLFSNHLYTCSIILLERDIFRNDVKSLFYSLSEIVNFFVFSWHRIDIEASFPFPYLSLLFLLSVIIVILSKNNLQP